jgi:NADH:ubiquinone reductase (H+-translocating)
VSGSANGGPRPRVVVLGGGFAGIGAARKLKDTDVDVVVVDKHDYHTFQPLLYQVATDLLPPSTVGHALRDLFHEQPNARVRKATATSVDLDKREIQFEEMEPLSYDYLVFGLGAEVNFFGVEGAAEHAFPLYTLPDAVRLKEHILERWEAADKDGSLIEDGALNVVVVGGGPTGVESAGAIAELYRANFSKDYPDIPQEQARIILVEAAPEIFGMFKTNLRRYAEKALAQRNVEVLTGEIVASISPTRVTLKSGTALPAHTLVWGAGLQANALAPKLGLELERANRIPVAPDLRVAGHPEVFAVGDVALITAATKRIASTRRRRKTETLPQLGGVALQSGEHAGENITRLVEGKETEPFEYLDKGTMATIGRGAAVVQFARGPTMTGKTAAMAWGSVHLALLSTGEDRAKAMIDWTWAGLTHERAARITVRADDA